MRRRMEKCLQGICHGTSARGRNCGSKRFTGTGCTPKMKRTSVGGSRMTRRDRPAEEPRRSFPLGGTLRRARKSGAIPSNRWPQNSQDSSNVAGTRRGSSSSIQRPSSAPETSPSPLRLGDRSKGNWTPGKRGNTICWWRINHAHTRSIYLPVWGRIPRNTGRRYTTA